MRIKRSFLILKAIIFFIVAVTDNLQLQAQPIFQKIYKGTGNGLSGVQTADGGYIIVGETNSFGAGWDDVYLICMDANGDTLWTKAYGGSDNDYSKDVRQTADGGYVITGWTRGFGAGWGDVYLVKTDAIGDIQWSKTFGGSTVSCSGYSIQQTTDLGYIITGNASGIGAGSSDVYLIKTDSIGNPLWTKTFGKTDSDFSYSVQQTTDEGYIITGNIRGFGAGGDDVYLIKTDNIGDTLWTKTFGGTGYDYGRSVQQTGDGGYIIAGFTNSFGAGNNDVYLIKTDSIGDTLWTKTYGGLNNDLGYSVKQTIDGGYIITGGTNSFGGGDTCDPVFPLLCYYVYLIKTDINGDTLWTKAFGGTGGGSGNTVRQTSDGGYFITGSAQGDVYFIKTDANGNSGGCNEYYTATIVSNTATLVGSGTIVGSGGGVNNPATIVSNTTIVDSVLCFTVGLPEKIGLPEKKIMQIYPNPTSGKITLQTKLSQNSDTWIIVYNFLGELVYKGKPVNQQIDLSDLPSGLYLLHIDVGETILRKKIIKL